MQKKFRLWGGDYGHWGGQRVLGIHGLIAKDVLQFNWRTLLEFGKNCGCPNWTFGNTAIQSSGLLKWPDLWTPRLLVFSCLISFRGKSQFAMSCAANQSSFPELYASCSISKNDWTQFMRTFSALYIQAIEASFWVHKCIDENLDFSNI